MSVELDRLHHEASITWERRTVRCAGLEIGLLA